MGQKVNPHGLRVGIIKDWNAKYYADKKTFPENIVEDQKLRELRSISIPQSQVLLSAEGDQELKPLRKKCFLL